MKRSKRKKRKSSLIPLLGLILGLCVVGYYPISEAIDAWKRGQIVSSMDRPPYIQDDSAKRELLDQAHAWNAQLAGEPSDIPRDQIWDYYKQLSMAGDNAAFSAVLIPSIALTMPIYHGTDEAVLSAGVGHLEQTSLPVGGKSTHTVVSAHSGMAGMRAFDDIRELKVGDLFGFKTLGDDYVYEVYDIDVVEPTDLSSLAIQKGEDLATLVTCTPYGINSHRLLVHGRRVAAPAGWDQAVKKPTAQMVVTNRRVWPFLVACATVVLVIAGNALRLRHKKKKALAKAQEATANEAKG